MSTPGQQKDDLEIEQWLDRAVERLVSELDPEQIILFGSYGRGTATRQSDIDLCVIWETKLPHLKRIGAILKILEDSPRPVEAVSYTPGEVRQMESPFVRRILDEGRVLYERGKTVAGGKAVDRAGSR